MGEFLVFALILFTFGWGSALLLPYVRRQWKGVGQSVDNEVIARLLEDTDQLAARLTQVEEELRFFQELHAPGDRGSLPSPGGEGEEA